MSDNTVVLFGVVSHALATIAAIAGAVFLAYHGKEGWGWLVFVAIVLGSVSIKSTPDVEPVEPAGSSEGKLPSGSREI